MPPSFIVLKVIIFEEFSGYWERMVHGINYLFIYSSFGVFLVIDGCNLHHQWFTYSHDYVEANVVIVGW